MDEKKLNELALFVQNLLKAKPLKYSEVREQVCKSYDVSKTKAGNILHALSRRHNFLALSFNYESLRDGVLYLPEQSAEARKMFKEIRESIPYSIRYVSKKLHKYLLSEARKIKLQNPELPVDLLSKVIAWKLKIVEPLARRLIGELESA